MTVSTLPVRYVTWVGSGAPAKNWFGKTGYLSVRGGSPAEQAFLFFTSPFSAAGANVLSAKVRLRTRAITGTGTHTLRLTMVNQGLRFGSMTWNNRPTQYRGASVTVSKTGALAENTVWEFDVTNLLQQVADGAPFYGLRIDTTVAERVLVQGAMTSALNPQLVVDWTLAPKPPASLSPSAGRVVGLQKPVLRWDFYDHAGNEYLKAIQVQTSTSPTFATVSWDSGAIDTSWCTLNLSETTFPAPASGAVTYWRVRNQDRAGLWSGWSAVTSWTYRALPSVTITAPSAAAPTVTDPTPTFGWSYSSPTGSPQTRWATSVRKKDAAGRWVVVEASGTRVGNDNNWSASKNLATSGQYRFIVDVYDGYQREATTGDPGRASAVQDFTYVTTSTVTPPTNLTATNDYPEPGTTLTWKAAAAPDWWVIYRGDMLLARYPGPDLVNGAAPNYRIRDAIPPNGEHTWRVYAISNGKTSVAATVTGEERHVGTWLCDEDTGLGVCIQNDTDHDMAMPEVSSVHEVLGSDRVVLITEAQRGYEGTITGGLYDVLGMPANHNAKAWRANLLGFKADPGARLRLLLEDLSFPVVVRNITVKGDTKHHGEWLASFEFFQTDELIFDSVLGDTP